MKIRDARIFRVSLPYRIPFTIAGGTTAKAEHIFVELEAENGLKGYGEAAPMPSYSKETPASIIHSLKSGMLEQLKGESIFDIERILEKLDGVSRGDFFATAAIDFALHDLIGKSMNLPCYKLMGGLVRDRIDLSWPVGIKEKEEMVEEAKKYVGLGYRTVKLKIGRDSGQDIENVRAVREALGKKIKIRVDANQGYSLAEALRLLPELEKFDLEMIEQPVSARDIEGMAKLCEKLKTPILADESLRTLSDAVSLVKHKGCDIFNIKVMRVGGLQRSKKIAAIAEASSIPCEVGSMVEMGPGTAAGLHFVLSTSAVKYACEMIGHEMIDGDIIEEEEWISSCQNGFLGLPSKPGLGFVIKKKFQY
jgi:o-succinylbenzoate synthase